ncbi:MAG TPA: hypothetical protein EYH35_01655 [Thiotrichaceae bacterium]|nr:hypothetical protein [Thiotrichaceae bacterium]
MQLSQIKADIRLRSAWEAVDLGFAMVQTWAKIIYLPWAIFLTLLALVVWLIVPNDMSWLSPLIIWWLKPVYDRLLLYIVSQELFSLPVGVWQSLKKIPSLMRRSGLISGLTYRRFSASRGFNLPIWQLEGLKGVARKKRQNILHIRAHSQAVWLTIACIHIEIIIYLAFFGFVLLWLPSTMQLDFFTQFFADTGMESSSYIIELLSYIFYVLAIIIIEPFYIAGNFGLYINRRTQLEAWDIELVFRNMAERLTEQRAGKSVIKTSGVALALATLLFISMVSLSISPVAMANEKVADKVLAADKSKEVITELMKEENLKHKETISYWDFKEFDKKDDDDSTRNDDAEAALNKIGHFIGVLFEYGLWILLTVVIVLLIIYRKHWLVYFEGGREVAEVKEKPDVLFGMDIRPESLPDDIAAESQKLWQQGAQREALSLLYRGALAQLVNTENIALENSHTEGDVLQLSRQVLQENREQYLEQLTHIWRQAAYAHRFPNEEEAQYLFEHWKQDFYQPEVEA